MILYLAGPYSGDIDQNIATARTVAISVWQAGHVAICPHLNNAHFEQDCSLSYDEYIRGDLKIILRCDGVLMLPEWGRSVGACQERSFALAHDIPVYTEIPPLNPVEELRPQQVESFISTVMKMYRVHIEKNMDYSSANILGTGSIGLTTRIWDKVARLMNLVGFHIEISNSYFDNPKEPKNESIDDNLLDLATYAIIYQIYRSNAWGK
jgi:nucleoside 2-deoxyribosyltransferase